MTPLYLNGVISERGATSGKIRQRQILPARQILPPAPSFPNFGKRAQSKSRQPLESDEVWKIAESVSGYPLGVPIKEGTA